MLSQVWTYKFYNQLAILIFALSLTSSAFSAEKIEWGKSLEKGLAKAKEDAKPIILDFFADW